MKYFLKMKRKPRQKNDAHVKEIILEIVASFVVGLLVNILSAEIETNIGPLAETIFNIIFFAIVFIIFYIALRRRSVHWAASSILLLGLYLGISGYISEYEYVFKFDYVLKMFSANFSTEFISIALVVFVIDSLRESREERQEENLRQQMDQFDDNHPVLQIADEYQMENQNLHNFVGPLVIFTCLIVVINTIFIYRLIEKD